VARVLLIAFHYPPVGGPSAQRTLHLTRQLTLRGHEVVVVTGPGVSDYLWTPFDESTSALIPDVRVHRLSGPVPSQSRGLRRIGERVLQLDPPFRRWFDTELVQAVAGLGLPRPDVVLGEIVPYDTATGIVDAVRQTGAPWIADLHDPWALDEMWIYPTALQRLADRRRMRRVLRSAAAVVMNTSEAAARVRSAFPELGKRVHGIPMGFDPSDFEAPREATPDGIFRIVHTGTMYTEEGLRHRRTRRIRRLLGGMPNPTVDFLPRSHVYLLRALAVLEQRDASLVAPVEVHLAGAMTVGDREVAASSRRTVVHGFVSHADTMALVGSADLLFLPMHAMDGRAGLVPTKTYEYLGSGRPILAAVPDGDARELMEACGTATAVYPNDVQGMARVIEQHVLRWRAGEDPPALDAAVAAGYTWESIGNRVADVIEDVVGRTRS